MSLIQNIFFLNESHWKQGWRVTENGQLACEKGILASLLRFIRRIWRAWVSHPEDFDALVLRKFRELAQEIELIGDPEFSNFKTDNIKQILDQEDHFDESEFFRSMDKARRLFRRHKLDLISTPETLPATWEQIERGLSELRLELCREKITESVVYENEIQTFLAAPASCIDKKTLIETSLGCLWIPDQMLMDFHRSYITIDGVHCFGSDFPERSIEEFIEELASKGFSPQEISRLLQFCSQGSHSYSAKLCAPIAVKMAEEELETSQYLDSEYHINTSPDKWNRLYVVNEKRYVSQSSKKRIFGYVEFCFNLLENGRPDFLSGDIIAAAPEIPFY